MAKKPVVPPVSSPERTPPAPDDQHARDRIEREFDRNFLVEAGAGSGKTQSLARRMAAGIAAGACTVEHMAAVTFTRKAAAELRGRFQLALEQRLGTSSTARERERVEQALGNIERLFAGTIHAFCAHLLRERPVEAQIAPGFVEIDEVEDVRRRKQAWRDYVARERAQGSPAMVEMLAAGVRTRDLDGTFGVVCEHQDVAFPAGEGAMPDCGTAWRSLETFWRKLARLVPEAPDADHKCGALRLALDFGGRFDYAQRWKRQPATLAEFLGDWKRVHVTQKWWGGSGAEAKALVDAFKEDTVEPFVEAWRCYVYRLALAILTGARQFYAEERRRANVVNYVDLLLVTARLLRENPAVRQALQQKYRWFFIDEFQDTDPVQAEIFLLLAGESHPAATSPDPYQLPLRPGALFVVGDPKQSIYRFRRADIDIYNRVRDRIVAHGGEVLHLTANWRSLPGVCRLANTVFPGLFPEVATRQSPAFEPLDPRRREETGHEGPRLARLVISADVEKKAVPEREAEHIARYISAEIAAGRRRPGSFLILTRYKPRLAVYAEALDALEIPVEVSGAGRFGGSPQVETLALLLASLSDPLDGAALVGVLRGPLFGISDPHLHAFRTAGGRFELAAPLLGADAERLEEIEREGERAAHLAGELDRRFGPLLPALRRLRSWRRLTRTMPLGAAVDCIVDESGWLALAGTSPGGAKAGDLLQAVDYVRQVVESGGGLAEAAAALVEDDEVASEVETLPLEPGKRDVVRLMNLHKAKGLEAEVVFLADPTHGKPFGVDVRIVREAGVATGYLKVERAPEGRPWRVVLGEPRGWDGHEREEVAFRDAEVNRLLYVAATRARDLLVVGQWARLNARGLSQNEAWGKFDDILDAVEPLAVPGEVPLASRSVPDVSRAARERESRTRSELHERARQATWTVGAVTDEGIALRARAARVRHAMADAEIGGSLQPGDEMRDAADASLAVETPGARADAGAAWGALIHGLLEHAMRDPTATRDDLQRLARWLTVEATDLRPVIPDALDVVQSVANGGFWREAQLVEHHVEVPFALLVSADERAPDHAGAPTGMPQVLRGVVDLAYRTADGWRIVDYKTDRLGDAATLVERHRAQLQAYVAAWTRLLGVTGTRAGVFGVRHGTMGWMASPDQHEA